MSDGHGHYTFERVAEMYRQFNPDGYRMAGAKAVVAEDDAAMRRLIVQGLRKKGLQVEEAADGVTALKVIKESSPDIALLDIQMPKVSGLSILEAMRRDERFEKTPVIIVTARKSRQDVLAAHKLKANAYILKPFKVEELLQKVSELTEGPEDSASSPADEKSAGGSGEETDAASSG
jgi:two-component system chemotaxis response regulator CheY